MRSRPTWRKSRRPLRCGVRPKKNAATKSSKAEFNVGGPRKPRLIACARCHACCDRRPADADRSDSLRGRFHRTQIRTDGCRTQKRGGKSIVRYGAGKCARQMNKDVRNARAPNEVKFISPTLVGGRARNVRRLRICFGCGDSERRSAASC